MTEISPTLLEVIAYKLGTVEFLITHQQSGIKNFIDAQARTNGMDPNDPRVMTEFRAKLDATTLSNWKKLEDLHAELRKAEVAIKKVQHAAAMKAKYCDLDEVDAVAVHPILVKGGWPICSTIEKDSSKPRCGRCVMRIFWSIEMLDAHLTEPNTTNASSLSTAN